MTVHRSVAIMELKTGSTTDQAPTTGVRPVGDQVISDEEYVAALTVLRKMVANVEGNGTSGIPS